MSKTIGDNNNNKDIENERQEVECSKCGRVFTIDVLTQENLYQDHSGELYNECPHCGNIERDILDLVRDFGIELNQITLSVGINDLLLRVEKELDIVETLKKYLYEFDRLVIKHFLYNLEEQTVNIISATQNKENYKIVMPTLKNIWMAFKSIEDFCLQTESD